jgi:hypothetical protein
MPASSGGPASTLALALALAAGLAEGDALAAGLGLAGLPFGLSCETKITPVRAAMKPNPKRAAVERCMLSRALPRMWACGAESGAGVGPGQLLAVAANT